MNRKVYVILKIDGEFNDVEPLMVVDTEESAIETIDKLPEDVYFFYREVDYITSQNEQ